MKKLIIAALVVVSSIAAHAGDAGNVQIVLRCGEPKGVSIFSRENYKPTPDGFANVRPVVTIGEKKMHVVWGDADVGKGGRDMAWDAIIVTRDANTVTAVANEIGDTGVVTMMYTIDLKRKRIYYSAQHNNELMGSSVRAMSAECK